MDTFLLIQFFGNELLKLQTWLCIVDHLSITEDRWCQICIMCDYLNDRLKNMMNKKGTFFCKSGTLMYMYN